MYFQLDIVIHFIFSDKSEVQQQQQQEEGKEEEERADDSGKISTNSHKRTASEVCLSLNS